MTLFSIIDDERDFEGLPLNEIVTAEMNRLPHNDPHTTLQRALPILIANARNIPHANVIYGIKKTRDEKNNDTLATTYSVHYQAHVGRV